MYTYSLYVQDSNEANEKYLPVRPGPDLEFATWAEVIAQAEHDVGAHRIPQWMRDDLPPTEYVGVEPDFNINGTWFLMDIEGSQDHVLPPVAERIAWANHG